MKKLSFFFIIVSLLSIALVYSCSNEDVESESSTPTQYTLNVIASEGGSVTPEATGTYDEGAQLTLSAIPDEGFMFCRWLGRLIMIIYFVRNQKIEVLKGNLAVSY